jgi:hypothetical protein
MELVGAGGLTYQHYANLQLRDSTGLSPVSPLGLPIRGIRHPDHYTIVRVLYACSQNTSIAFTLGLLVFEKIRFGRSFFPVPFVKSSGVIICL